jgi:hypothetical protein
MSKTYEKKTILNWRAIKNLIKNVVLKLRSVKK